MLGAENLHMTIAYGDGARPLQSETVPLATPVPVQLTGVGSFNGETPIPVVLVNVPRYEIRLLAEELLHARGYQVRRDFGWIPHITLPAPCAGNARGEWHITEIYIKTVGRSI